MRAVVAFASKRCVLNAPKQLLGVLAAPTTSIRALAAPKRMRGVIAAPEQMRGVRGAPKRMRGVLGAPTMRTLGAIVVVVVALGGCVTKYTRTTMVNAPGTTDLAKPPARELGDPDAYEPAADPGTSTLAVIPIPSVLLGTGRGNPGDLVSDINLEVRFEHSTDAGRAPFGKRALAFTAGLVGVQVDNHGGSYGAMFGEVSFRFPTIKGVLPMDIGVGPVVYPTDFEAGGQITVRLPILALRARYVERSGFEFWAGYQIPIPFLFQRSR